MMAQDGSHKAPIFDGIKYTFWKVRMEAYMSSLWFGVWNSVNDGYTSLAPPPIDPKNIRLYANNGKETNAI